jgi:hypothetical protein
MGNLPQIRIGTKLPQSLSNQPLFTVDHMIAGDTGARANKPLPGNGGNGITVHGERTVGNVPRTGLDVYLIRGLSPIPLSSFPSLWNTSQ